jgi:hypothetical protein
MFRRLVTATLFLLAPAFGLASGVEYANPLNSKNLRWPDRTIKISVSSSLWGSEAAIKPQSDVAGALLRALQKWEEVAYVTFEVVVSDVTTISPPGVSGDDVSVITVGPDLENVLAFNKTFSNASAMTRVFYDARGTITEADVVLNPSQQFTTDQTPGTFDLEAVLSHELGHLLGLKHSLDPSAVMFDGVPRNGGIESAGVVRSLSEDDVTKARSLYGANSPDLQCCAVVRGRISNFGEASGKAVVWLQSSGDGSLVQLQNAGEKGGFEFRGLRIGSYDVIAQNAATENVLSAIGLTSVRANNETGSAISIEARSRTVSFDLQFIGVNGQLSKRAISVAAGNTYRLTIAGPGLRQEGIRFSTTSPYLRLDPVRTDSPDLVKGLPTRFFDLFVSNSVRPGRYSIFAEDREHLRRYFLGAIAVGNPAS